MTYLDNLKYIIRGKRALANGEAELKLISELSRFVDTGLAFDIGGNMGEYAYTFENLFRQTVVLEPIASCCEYLKSVTNNSVTVVEAAVSDFVGHDEIVVPIDTRQQQVTALATLTSKEFHNQSSISYEIRTTTLNDLKNVFGTPSVVKIDVEGSEYSVLSGANLGKKQFNKTIFIIEIEERHTNKHPREFFEYMKHFGFEAYSYDRKNLLRYKNSSSVDNFVGDNINFVFFTNEIARDLSQLIK